MKHKGYMYCIYAAIGWIIGGFIANLITPIIFGDYVSRYKHDRVKKEAAFEKLYQEIRFIEKCGNNIRGMENDKKIQIKTKDN